MDEFGAAVALVAVVLAAVRRNVIGPERRLLAVGESHSRRKEPIREPTRVVAARIATPGQAGPPAEFKHINKRRKRNLPGFP